jgi:hypothetical protein
MDPRQQHLASVAGVFSYIWAMQENGLSWKTVLDEASLQ